MMTDTEIKGALAKFYAALVASGGDFAYLLEPEPTTLTVKEFREKVKKVTTVSASKRCIAHRADPWTERRMQGSRKHYELFQDSDGRGWYLPARAVSRLRFFSPTAKCSVVPGYVDDYTGRIYFDAQEKDTDHQVYVLRIQWGNGGYDFALICEDNWT